MAWPAWQITSNQPGAQGQAGQGVANSQGQNTTPILSAAILKFSQLLLTLHLHPSASVVGFYSILVQFSIFLGGGVGDLLIFLPDHGQNPILDSLM